MWLELPFPRNVAKEEADRQMEEIVEMNVPSEVVSVENHGALAPDLNDPADTEPVTGVLCITLECGSLEQARKAADDIVNYYIQHTKCKNPRIVTVEKL